MIDDYKKLQEALVLTICESVTEPWERIVINYEMEYGEDGVEHDRLGFCIVKAAGGEFEKRRFSFTDQVGSRFLDLNDASVEVNKAHWTVCDLVIDRNGKYEMKFSYDKPKRIHAILDEESYFRFGKYLETYKASLKKQPD